MKHRPGFGLTRGKTEEIEAFIKRFKRGVIEKGILTEYHERASYESDSIKNKKKRLTRLFRARKSQIMHNP